MNCFDCLKNNFWLDVVSVTILMMLMHICILFQVRNMRWLGFRVPLAIVNKAHQANQLYPFAISLIESVRTYEQTLEKVRIHLL